MCRISSRTRALSGSDYATEKSRRGDGRREGGRPNYEIILQRFVRSSQISPFSCNVSGSTPPLLTRFETGTGFVTLTQHYRNIRLTAVRVIKVLKLVTKSSKQMKVIKADQKPPTHTKAGFVQAIDTRRASETKETTSRTPRSSHIRPGKHAPGHLTVSVGVWGKP